mmetsp:Transcript_58239/g.135604  ORF Transcript_58239/g.135604 Transcript_58239/m.135604 type:complete len:367 (+) Transcript_58239:708-1808(+)
MLPCLETSVFLKLARELTMTSCSWSFWLVTLMSAAGNVRLYWRAAFGDHGKVKDVETSRSDLVGEEPRPSGDVKPKAASPWGVKVLCEISSGKSPKPVFSVFCKVFAWRSTPSRIFNRSGGGTPIMSASRSSFMSKRGWRPASSIPKSFLALQACSKPKLSQAAKKSSSRSFSSLWTSSPFCQASLRQLNLWSNSPRALSSMTWVSGSMSWKVTCVLSGRRPCSSSCQMAFLFPLKGHSSRIRLNLPKERAPKKSGSSAVRQATTVDPYLCFKARRSCSSMGMLASMVASVPPRFFAGAPPSRVSNDFIVEVLWPALESGDLDVAMTAGSPRCRLRVHSGSRSQIVMTFRPGIGCKHRKSLWTLWG